jgi:hypothetical protein
MARAVRSLIAALALLLLAAAGPAHAAAHRACPPKRGTITKNSYGRVWHQGRSLWACTTVYGRRPQSVRLGPWRHTGRLVWDGLHVAWTQPLTRDGVRSDRLWAAEADTGKRWISGARAVPASAGGPAREARVSTVKLQFESVAWVTAGGDVVLALHSPQSDPAPVGTPPVTLQASDRYLLIGSWAGVGPSALASSLTLKTTTGDGDECGGVDTYRLTVQPDAAQPAVGADWDGGWERSNCG